MKPSGAIVFWTGAIGVLLFVEVAELTHLFTLPVESVIGNIVAFIFALVFTTILALVGALFMGIYISQRLQSPGGFTRFEEEMLKMRADVQRITESLGRLRADVQHNTETLATGRPDPTGARSARAEGAGAPSAPVTVSRVGPDP